MDGYNIFLNILQKYSDGSLFVERVNFLVAPINSPFIQNRLRKEADADKLNGTKIWFSFRRRYSSAAFPAAGTPKPYGKVLRRIKTDGAGLPFSKNPSPSKHSSSVHRVHEVPRGGMKFAIGTNRASDLKKRRTLRRFRLEDSLDRRIHSCAAIVCSSIAH